MSTLAPTVLSSAQTGNGDSTATGVRQMRADSAQRGMAVVITNVAGATPTVTVNIQGSVDGTNFYNIPYALVATPSTFVITALTITSAVTTTYLLQGGQPWQMLKLVYSANTNQTMTATAYL